MEKFAVKYDVSASVRSISALTAARFSGRHRVKSWGGRELWKARLHNQFLLSDLTALYCPPITFSFLLIIVNSYWNCNSGSTLKKKKKLHHCSVSFYLAKQMHLLSPGHGDCVEVIGTACHPCEFMALKVTLQLMFSLLILRKGLWRELRSRDIKRKRIKMQCWKKLSWHLL